MSAATEGLDDFLLDRRIAVATLLDRMIVSDLARTCSRPNISEAEVAAAVARFSILHEASA